MLKTRFARMTLLAAMVALISTAALSAPTAAAPGDGIVVIRPAAPLGPLGVLPQDARTNPDGSITFQSADPLLTYRFMDEGGACLDTGLIGPLGAATLDLSGCGPAGTVIFYRGFIHVGIVGTITIA